MDMVFEEHRYSPADPIFLRLQKIGRNAATGRIITALEVVDRALLDYPEEPVFYLRRADLLVQQPEFMRNRLGLNLFKESTRMIGKLAELQDEAPLFPLQNHREKRLFGCICTFYSFCNWFDLHDRTLQVATHYFPDTRFNLESPSRNHLDASLVPPAILKY